jgi:hypothetical protein
MTDRELEGRAADFWAGTDLADAYPRGIEQAIALQLPVTVVKLPIVTVQAAGWWLRRHHDTPAFPPYRRDLMGCLYAACGHGFIFVCGADEPEEQRFTLAHDTAHFLVDYWWPRLQVIQALGTSITDVLDGRRRASIAERASAILAKVRVGPHYHLLPRQNGEGDVRIACVEDRADDLGLELVAPCKRVLQMVQAMPAKVRTDTQAACGALGTFFGLPAYVFGPLISALHRTQAPSFLEDALRLLGREA